MVIYGLAAVCDSVLPNLIVWQHLNFILKRLGVSSDNKVLNKISKKIGNFEVGPVLGGKPFEMKT